MTKEDGGNLRTTDMTLAAVLQLRGYHLKLEAPSDGQRQAFWIVEEAQFDEDLDELLDEYRHGTLQVNPVLFMQEVRKVRKRLYQLLGVASARVS